MRAVSLGTTKAREKGQQGSDKSDDLAKKSSNSKPRAAHKSHHPVLPLSKNQNQDKNLSQKIPCCKASVL